jgi:oligopeptide/dipeptide ABC transporter ATP-binding protein
VTFLLISHDLAVVANLCDEIAVMFAGRFVETGPAAALLTTPAHPYTRALIDAAPRLSPSPATVADAVIRPLSGIPEASADQGCPYAARCEFAQRKCQDVTPALTATGDGREAACHFPIHNQSFIGA